MTLYMLVRKTLAERMIFFSMAHFKGTHMLMLSTQSCLSQSSPPQWSSLCPASQLFSFNMGPWPGVIPRMPLCYGTLLCLSQSITIAQISRRYRLFIKAVNTLRSIELEREIWHDHGTRVWSSSLYPNMLFVCRGFIAWIPHDGQEHDWRKI
jgi:hypothetical protein